MEKKLQIPPLRYPGFPVELGGVGELHAASSEESRTRDRDRRREQEIRVRSVEKHFQERSAELQIPRLPRISC
jgi:hypothetical protein